MKQRTLWLILALIVLVRVGYMVALPLFDPTEGRYAVVGNEMARTGDWVTPTLWMDGKNLPFLGKPPLHFWLTAGAIRLLGRHEFAARLPSLLCALLVLTLTLVVGNKLNIGRAGRLAVLLMLSSVLFLGLMGAVVVDMTLTLGVSGALLCYMAFLAISEPRLKQRWSLAVFALLAVGFMTKGPVAIILFGLPVFTWTAWNRRWSDLRYHAWVPGVAPFLALTVPWFVLCERHNPGFLRYFFINENILRFVTHHYGDRYGSGHLAPRGTAILMLLIAAMPWSLVLAYPIVKHVTRTSLKQDFRDPVAGLALLAVVTQTLFWCLARQLLITYLLPTIPMLMLWIAIHLQSRQVRRSALATAVAVVTAAAVAAPVVIPFINAQRGLKQALAVACTLVPPDARGPSVVCARRTPYSAFFYARDHLLAHPKESVQESLLRAQRDHRNYVYVLQQRYMSRLSPALRQSLAVSYQNGSSVVGVMTGLAPSEKRSQPGARSLSEQTVPPSVDNLSQCGTIRDGKAAK